MTKRWIIMLAVVEMSAVAILAGMMDVWSLAIVVVAQVFSAGTAWIYLRARFADRFNSKAADYAKLFRMHPQPMWVYDLKTLRFLAVNDATILLYGYSEAEFLQMTIKDIRPDDDVPALIEATEKIKLNFNSNYHWAGVWRHKRKDGELRYMEISSHEVTYAGRKAELVFAYDVTKKMQQDIKLQTLNRDLEKQVMKRTGDLLQLNQKLVNQNKVIRNSNVDLHAMADQLREANRKIQHHAELKTKFVSMASHEFRNPLSTIKYTAEILKSRLSSAPEAEMIRRIENIERQVTHMTSVLDDVLTIGKTESARLLATMTPVDVRDFASRIVMDVQCANGSHEIKLSIDPNVPDLIQSDEKFMRNIFINLLTNAIKYSPERNEVFFYIRAYNDHTVWIVKDFGAGIDPGEMSKIFEPFYRVSPASNIPGAGLGLTIVKKAVDLIGGQIVVESEVNAGSVFTVKIPCSS